MSASGQRASVILVDDHPAVLRQTLQLLSDEFEVLDAREDGGHLVELVAQMRPDLIVLDITLGGLNGIYLAAELKAQGSTAKIVFLTVHADQDYAREAFEVGATGYVVKPRLASDLVPALRAALKGQRFVSPCQELADWSDDHE